MIAAADLLVRLARDGLRVALDGDRLRVAPASRMTDEQRALILRAKPHLLALLRDAHYTTAQLMRAIDGACAARGDADGQRLALRSECADLDPTSQADLLEHFRQVEAQWRGAARDTSNPIS